LGESAEAGEGCGGGSGVEKASAVHGLHAEKGTRGKRSVAS
jgi:hypothetical protein